MRLSPSVRWMKAIGQIFIDSCVISGWGRPKLRIELEGDTISYAEVLQSAPCGATYFVARKFVGLKVDERLNKNVAKYWHSYPCVGSMRIDPELGDAILHVGGYNHYDAVHRAIKATVSRDFESLRVLERQRTMRLP